MAGTTRRILGHNGQCKLLYEIGEKTEEEIEIGIEIETEIERNVK